MVLCDICSAKQKVSDVKALPKGVKQAFRSSNFRANTGQGGWFRESIPHSYAVKYGKVPNYMKRGK